MPQVLFDGVGANAESAAISCAGYSRMRVRVWSTEGSTADFTVEGKADVPSHFTTSQPWFPLEVVSNPTAAGEYLTIPTVGQLRVTLTNWASGTIYALLEKWVDQNFKAVS